MIKISDRLNFIFSHIPTCKFFADVGCDHGYISYLMLEQKKCEKLVYSDISAPSLQKAQALLKDYKNATAVVCDGLEKVDRNIDCALIAGMGGENVIHILQQGFLPPTLILQPMKNTNKLREFLNINGYLLQKDFVFFAEDKYYDLLVAVKGKEKLTKQQIEYGKDNILNPQADFLNYLSLQIQKKQKILLELTGSIKDEFNKALKKEKTLYERLRIKRGDK